MKPIEARQTAHATKNIQASSHFAASCAGGLQLSSVGWPERFWMSVRQSSLVWENSRSRCGARLVALAIADFANDQGEAFPSVETLAKKAAISERAARIAIRELEALGELQTSMNAGPRGVNLYQLTIGGADSAGGKILPGEESDREGGRKQQGGGQKTTERGAESAPKPSGTVSEPSVNRQGVVRQQAVNNCPVEKKDVKPTSPEAIAISRLFNRRETTAWAPKEIDAFKSGMRRGAINPESIALISAYYVSERAKGGSGIHRRDLLTFLNNFDGELDRANAFKTNPKAHERTNPTQRSDSTRNVGHNANLDYSKRTPKETTGSYPGLKETLDAVFRGVPPEEQPKSPEGAG